MATGATTRALISLMVLASCTATPQGLPVADMNSGRAENVAHEDVAAGPGGDSTSTDLSGTYVGTATSTVQAGYCSHGGPVTNFRVEGNNVMFGQLRGTIRSDGFLQMVFGGVWVIGNFNGPHFSGRYLTPACTFNITLTRTE